MNNKIRISIILSTGLISLIFLFQNCSKMEFRKIDPLATINRVPGGNCVPGKKLSVFFDNEEQTFIGDIVSYTGNISATTNYGYTSASAHPVNGPDPIGFEVHNFFYEGTDGLMLTFYGNVDSDDSSQGSPDNQYSLQITTRGNNGVDKVVFVDDPGQATTGGDIIALTKFSDRNEYQASFHYWYNTDGGVIGPFNNQNYEIHVKILSAGDLKGARFYSSDGGSFNLGLSGLMSYVIKYREYETCN